eukprot:7389120-Prymnesium_polylepis.1
MDRLHCAQAVTCAEAAYVDHCSEVLWVMALNVFLPGMVPMNRKALKHEEYVVGRRKPVATTHVAPNEHPRAQFFCTMVHILDLHISDSPIRQQQPRNREALVLNLERVALLLLVEPVRSGFARGPSRCICHIGLHCSKVAGVAIRAVAQAAEAQRCDKLLKPYVELHPLHLHIDRPEAIAAWRQGHYHSGQLLGERLKKCQAQVA